MGAYSGRFMAGARVTQTPDPEPDSRHGRKTFPDNAWSDPPAPVAQLPVSVDVVDAVAPPMQGRGIVLDLGHRWGHKGTGKTAFARRPQWRGRGESLEDHKTDLATAAALAHGDTSAGFWADYSPYPEQFAGSEYDVDVQDGIPGAVQGSRRIVHGRPGGQFSDATGGQGADYQPTGFRLGVARRWALASYSTPALGAMHSSSPARGVLPQVIAIPVDQPATGGALYNSGYSSQQRQLPPSFTTPRLFRSPISASDQMIAAQDPAPVYGPVI